MKTPNKDYRLAYWKLDAKYDIDHVVRQAFDYGKNLNPIDKYKAIKNPRNNNIR